MAVERGDDGSLTRLLLQTRLEHNVIGSAGKTLPHIAVRQQSIALLSQLLAMGANPQVTDSHGNTPMYDAIPLENEHMLRLLIDYGANKEARNRSGETPLCMAARYGY
jgi:ankyrin repeat protein